MSIQICIIKGSEKQEVLEAKVLENWGLENDAHGGMGDRQVSIFPIEAMSKVPQEKYTEVIGAGHTENITISGIPLKRFSEGCMIQIGDEVLIQVKRIGKEVCEEHGRPYIVSREGRFGIALRGGVIKKGDKVKLK